MAGYSSNLVACLGFIFFQGIAHMDLAATGMTTGRYVVCGACMGLQYHHARPAKEVCVMCTLPVMLAVLLIAHTMCFAADAIKHCAKLQLQCKADSLTGLNYICLTKAPW